MPGEEALASDGAAAHLNVHLVVHVTVDGDEFGVG